MNSEQKYYENLVGIILKTRGTRFTAAASLTLQDRFSVATLALLSIFLIGLSVVLLAEPDLLGTSGAKYFGVLSVIASVWILVITLFDYALSRGLLAYQLHENAIRITLVLRGMERELAKANPDFDQLRTLAAEYEREVADTKVNHSAADYRMYVYSRQTPSNPINSMLIALRNFLFGVFYFLLAVPSHLIVITFIMGATIWFFLR